MAIDNQQKWSHKFAVATAPAAPVIPSARSRNESITVLSNYYNALRVGRSGSGVVRFACACGRKPTYIVVNHYADIAPATGDLQIIVKVNLTYQHGIVSYMNAPDGVLMMGRAFRVVSEPANSDALAQKAEHLRQRLMDVHSGMQWPVLTKMLFTLPENVALPTWRTLINDPKSQDSPDVVLQLVRLGTRTSIILLDEMRSSNVYSASTRQSARYGIEDLYQAGSPDLRAYLEQMEVTRYGRISKVFQSIQQDEAKRSQRRQQSGLSQN